jgi:hypothetical protein
METIKRTGVLRRYSEWKRSSVNLTQYLKEGDAVDEDFYMYALEVVPPLDYGSILQIGEPYSMTAEGKETFFTLQKYGNDWIYTGHRTARDRVEIA